MKRFVALCLMAVAFATAPAFASHDNQTDCQKVASTYMKMRDSYSTSEEYKSLMNIGLMIATSGKEVTKAQSKKMDKIISYTAKALASHDADDVVYKSILNFCNNN